MTLPERILCQECGQTWTDYVYSWQKPRPNVNPITSGCGLGRDPVSLPI